ncbi:15042_t:CDS:1, partial [Cetraspora pellucida]
AKPAKYKNNIKHKCSSSTFTPTPTSTIIPCCQTDNPAYQTGTVILHASIDFTSVPSANGDAQKCCEACFNDPNCTEWGFSPGICSNYGPGSCNVGTLVMSGPETAGGILRCSDGCLNS